MAAMALLLMPSRLALHVTADKQDTMEMVEDVYEDDFEMVHVWGLLGTHVLVSGKSSSIRT